MNAPENKKRTLRIAFVAVAILLFLFVYVENWGRDFTNWEARIEDDAADPTLRPLAVNRPPAQMAAATKMAARRIGNWSYVGDAVDGETTLLYFVRTARLLRLQDDVTIRLSPGSGGTVLRAESIARMHLGDLGRNPRTLRRFVNELQVVLEGSVRSDQVSAQGLPRR